ncbi:MAG: response regulator transcription factor [bacterium]|jgi:two-component system KDP operon response regulator KdpE|nr:response regulator transcription factor [bacterium]
MKMEKNKDIRILIVDDEKAIRNFLRVSLAACGYSIYEAGSGKEALEKVIVLNPEVIILDLGLPDIDGIKVIRQIRKSSRTPIIILSVREEVGDKVTALEEGADDYLTKPFNIAELLARIRAVLRRLTPADQESIFRTGKLIIDFTKRLVTVSGKPVELTPTEYEIIKLMVRNAGKVLTHRQILKEVWNKTDELEGVFHLLRVTVSNLRSKIEPDPDRPTYILTEPCIGYRLQDF